MPYKYACFISYRHRGTYMENFVRKLTKSLSNALQIELANDEEVYLDEDRLQIGNIVDAKIAEAIKQSCCMIVIYTRSYLNKLHPYCARELATMIKLETRRREGMDKDDLSLIIPILLS